MARRDLSDRLPGWLDRDERGEVRQRVSLPAGIYGRHTERAVVRIVDLTRVGCRIACSRRASIGAFFTVEIAGMVSVEAWVAWTRADEIGLDFVHPMPQPLIDHLVQLGTGPA